MQPQVQLTKDQLLSMYGKMYFIRIFEDKVYDLFLKKLVPGTTHLCQGQEAISVGVNSVLKKDDWITCTYRGHGNAIAKGVDPRAVMAEILGKSTGCNRGKGGSMHVADADAGVLGSYAIVGAGIPVAAGAGLSSKYRGSGQVAAAFFGDGAVNIGAFHEGLNFASLFKLPVIFVCENNLYGEYTHISRSTTVDNVADRAAAYSIPGVIVDGNDVIQVNAVAAKAVERARAGEGPTLLECKTYRQKGHSRTDPGKYRPDEEVKLWLARDPIKLLHDRLLSDRMASPAELKKVEMEQEAQLDVALRFAMDSPYPAESEVTTNVYV